jgi:hypothetical protein
VNKTITEKATQETRDFYPMVRPSDTCLLPRCGVPMDEDYTQPLSSDPMINLNTTVFYFRVFSCLRGISIIWSLSPLQWWSQKKHRSKEGKSNTHKIQSQHTHAHKWRLELKWQHGEFTTRMELKSLTWQIKCVGVESKYLSMLGEYLCYCSMCLEVPFYSPKAAMSRWRST